MGLLQPRENTDNFNFSQCFKWFFMISAQLSASAQHLFLIFDIGLIKNTLFIPWHKKLNHHVRIAFSPPDLSLSSREQGIKSILNSHKS